MKRIESVNRQKLMLLTLPLAMLAVAVGASAAGNIEANSKVFVKNMNGFGPSLVAALEKKQVPLVVVAQLEEADYIIDGSSKSKDPNWSKVLILGESGSDEHASINVFNRTSGTIVFAYSVAKGNSFRGEQSTAEACAKHLRRFVLGQH